MTAWICRTCAVEHRDSAEPPAVCAICEDERQWVPAAGQQWTSVPELAAAGHHTAIEQLETDLWAITTSPRLGIGQRGLLLCTPAGNLLWEPPGYLDDQLLESVRDLGGVAMVSASHPHLTGVSIQWSHCFDNAPVFVAAADEHWIRRPDDAIELWSGVSKVLDGVTFVPCGGHFAGSSVVHWQDGADGRGVLLTGDTIGICADLKSVTAMRSFPNYIPLPERAINRLVASVAPFDFDRLYGAFSAIDRGAKPIVEASFARYVGWLRGDASDDI